jgi:catechol 2,3-dioxygenase-like lactoylglutathione lyase family enzyme
MAVRVGGLDHVALAVRDLDRSAAFYRDVLGFTRVYEREWPVPVMMAAPGGTGVALFEAASGPDGVPPPVRVLHVAFRVERDAFEAAREKLATCGLAPEFSDHEVSHSLYFHDPDGHRLELTTYDI